MPWDIRGVSTDLKCLAINVGLILYCRAFSRSLLVYPHFFSFVKDSTLDKPDSTLSLGLIAFATRVSSTVAICVRKTVTSLTKWRDSGEIGKRSKCHLGLIFQSGRESFVRWSVVSDSSSSSITKSSKSRNERIAQKEISGFSLENRNRCNRGCNWGTLYLENYYCWTEFIYNTENFISFRISSL